MEMEKAKLEPNPRDDASFLSKMTFWWLCPLVVKGFKKPLEKTDIYDAQAQDASLRLGDLVSKNWTKEVTSSKSKGRNASYIRALIRSFGVSYLLYGLFAFVEECIFRICAPLFLGHYIRYFNDVPGYTDTHGYLLALGIVVVHIFIVLTHHPFFYCVTCAGMKIRIASCALIYRKALRLSTRALGQTTVGQLVNLLSNDVSRFDTSVIFIHYLWIGPLQTIISTVILWYEVGSSCLAGICLILFYVMILSYMGRMFSKLRLATAIRTDERIRIMNEMVTAMRVIKMYAWEKPFNRVVEAARRLESSVIMKSHFLRAINMTVFLTSAKIIAFLIFLSYVLNGNVLTAEKVFLTFCLVSNMQLTMSLFFPFAISSGSETIISCRRIQTFLEMEEKEDCSKVVSSALRPKSQDCYVEGHGIYARWDHKSSEDTLKNVSFFVKAGEIMALIGPVGSGKSSLLHSIISELPIKEGSINVRGKIAYASQEPWLFSGSVRDNILFGQPYNDKRYSEVIKVCALERDLELFPEGDHTAVGERGVSLSGGQKARINLARAVYFDADIYLLDDPLSAVDAHVGNHLFEQCISKFLRDKVTILATHQQQFLKSTSHILILRNGYVEAQGTYNQMKNQGVDFAGIIAEGEEEQTTPTMTQKEEKDDHLITKTTKLRRANEAWNLLHGSATDMRATLTDSNTFLATSAIGDSVLSMHEDEIYAEDDIKPEQEKEVGTETKSTGSVRLKVYFQYFLAGGGPLIFVLLMALNTLCEVCFVGSGYWLSYWTNMEQLYGESTESRNQTLKEQVFEETTINGTDFSFTSEDRFRYVYIYTTITVLLLIAVLVRTVLFFRICVTSSRNLHNRMFAAVIRIPMRFFETHPTGQILNRFTKDIGQVDDLLPPAIYDFITIMFTLAGIISMILYLNIWILGPTVVLGGLFFLMRWIYISFAREIKRLEGITRSPVFTHLSSTFHGLPTIRAFEAQNAAASQFDNYQDLHTSTWFLFLSSTRIFGACLDTLSSFYIAIVTVSFMFQKDVMGGDVGLGISLAMMMSGMLQWGVRQSAEIENHMTSVERILEYSKLTQEVSKDAKQVPKEPDWPSKGNLTFENVYLYYNEDEPPVLKNLNFTIGPAEKVGIVGRTGAGKSSLLACLFRLTPPQGKIIIDGVHTDTLHLEDLRKSLSIIPQDPTLFTGTVRYNLDPFSKYNDEEIWNALEQVQLKEPVIEMNGQLSAHISEGGRNLSVGQRQLMCLARAILKHNKILVMDEATANVDPQTDNWIQQTIRDKFTDCTVLTIAHRLHTVMDSDRVMVMDSGKLKEFAAPFQLLKDPDTIFSHLVNQTGPATSQQLKKMAEEAFFNKQKIPTQILTTTDHKSSDDLSAWPQSKSEEPEKEKLFLKVTV